MAALRIVAFLGITLATDAACIAGDGTCGNDRFSMLQVHNKELSDEGVAEVMQLIHQASDCAGHATALVRNFGQAWTDFMEDLLPQNSKVAQLIDLLTSTLKEGRMQALAAIGIAERTKPPCLETLQQTNSSMLLEVTQALRTSTNEQVEELKDTVEAIEATGDRLTKLVSGTSALSSLVCPAFGNFIENYSLETIPVLKQHIQKMIASTSPVAEDESSALNSMLQLKGTTAAMAQSLRLTESICKEELSAFVDYANHMVNDCKAIRECKTTLSFWKGLDDASQKCIDVFSQFSMDSDVRVCK